MPPAQHDPIRDQDVVKVKAPGGGSVSHGGTEYKPDADGNLTIPVHVRDAIEAAHHIPPDPRQQPVRVRFEPAQEPPKEEEKPEEKPEDKPTRHRRKEDKPEDTK